MEVPCCSHLTAKTIWQTLDLETTHAPVILATAPFDFVLPPAPLSRGPTRVMQVPSNRSADLGPNCEPEGTHDPLPVPLSHQSSSQAPSGSHTHPCPKMSQSQTNCRSRNKLWPCNSALVSHSSGLGTLLLSPPGTHQGTYPSVPWETGPQSV